MAETRPTNPAQTQQPAPVARPVAPAPRPPTAPAPGQADRPKDAAPEFSTTAVAEQVRPGPGETPPVTDADRDAARWSVPDIQKQYDAALDAVRNEADPTKRQTAINRKGVIARQLTDAQRTAERADRAGRRTGRANPAGR